jgi:hypothetical protein
MQIANAAAISIAIADAISIAIASAIFFAIASAISIAVAIAIVTAAAASIASAKNGHHRTPRILFSKDGNVETARYGGVTARQQPALSFEN